MRKETAFSDEQHSIIKKVEELLNREAARAAKKLLDTLDEKSKAEYKITLLDLICRLHIRDETCDMLMIEAEQHLAKSSDPIQKAAFFAFLSRGYQAKRIEPLAIKSIDDAIFLDPKNAAYPARKGHILLGFDKREEAEEPFINSDKLKSGSHGAYGAAYLAFVLGDFNGAEEKLNLCEDAQFIVTADRLRLSIARSKWDTEKEVSILMRILENTPEGEWRRYDRNDLGAALYASGKIDEALETWRSVWREDNNDNPGLFARHVLDAYEKSEGKGRRIRLQAFPTVKQRYNYCGPACMELVMRHFKYSATQESIAPHVKGDFGTPIYSMTNYLKEQGFETRRFEASPEQLTACLDANVPIIIEEEYSMTSHVAVIVGYDECLKFVMLQDPMTHSTSFRRWDTEKSIGGLFRNAALAAFPKDNRDIAEALDKGKVLNMEHLCSFDEAGNPEIRYDNDKILEICTRALSLEDDFPAAYKRRLYVLLNKFERERTKETEDAFLKELCEARCRYIGWEFPHEIHAQYLISCSRFYEAVIQFEEAKVRDRGDANHPERQAACWMDLKRDDRAEKMFLEALKIDTSHIPATKNLATHMLNKGDIDKALFFSKCACEMEPQNPYCFRIAFKIVEKQGLTEEAIVLARKTAELAPNNPWDQIDLAEALRESSEVIPERKNEALEIFVKSFEKWPNIPESAVYAAEISAEESEYEKAETLLINAAENAPDNRVPFVMHRLITLETRNGRYTPAAELTDRIVNMRPCRNVYWEYLNSLDRLNLTQKAIDWLQSLNPNEDYPKYELPLRLAKVPFENQEDIRSKFESALKIWPTDAQLKRAYSSFVAVTDLKESVEILKAHPHKDNWIGIYLTKRLIELEEYDEAKSIIESLSSSQDSIGSMWQHLYDRVLLCIYDSPSSAMEYLNKIEIPQIHHLRAKYCFSAAIGEEKLFQACCEQIPIDDKMIVIFSKTAARQKPAFRHDYKRRLEAQLRNTKNSYDRRTIEARLAAFGALEGNETDFLRILNTEKDISIIDNDLTAPLHSVRDSRLDQMTLKKLVEQPDGGVVPMLADSILKALNEDLNGSVKKAEEILTIQPDQKSATNLIMRAKLMQLKLDDASYYAKRTMYAATGRWWTEETAALALIAFLNKDLKESGRLTKQVKTILQADGDNGTASLLPLSIFAAMSGDTVAISKTRQLRGQHLYAPNAPFWDKLIETTEALSKSGELKAVSEKH